MEERQYIRFGEQNLECDQTLKQRSILWVNDNDFCISDYKEIYENVNLPNYSLVGIGWYGDIIEFVNYYNSDRFPLEIKSKRQLLSKVFSSFVTELEKSRKKD